MASLNKELQANLKEVCELMQRHAICENDERDMVLEINLANDSFIFCMLETQGFHSCKYRSFRFYKFNEPGYNERMIGIIERMLQP